MSVQPVVHLTNDSQDYSVHSVAGGVQRTHVLEVPERSLLVGDELVPQLVLVYRPRRLQRVLPVGYVLDQPCPVNSLCARPEGGHVKPPSLLPPHPVKHVLPYGMVAQELHLPVFVFFHFIYLLFFSSPFRGCICREARIECSAEMSASLRCASMRTSPGLRDMSLRVMGSLLRLRRQGSSDMSDLLSWSQVTFSLHRRAAVIADGNSLLHEH